MARNPMMARVNLRIRCICREGFGVIVLYSRATIGVVPAGVAATKEVVKLPNDPGHVLLYVQENRKHLIAFRGHGQRVVGGGGEREVERKE